jgi:Uncharacterized protein conserved in bacteria (DUF2188)
MSGKLFIERRPEEGDYAIRRPGAQRISDHETTQAGAIERAREIDPAAAILVERVRYTDRGSPDKWRKP